MMYNEECIKGMARHSDDSIDVIITDPPYGVLKHKMETNVNIDDFFVESWRVLKSNGFIAFFGQQPTLTAWNAAAFEYFNYKNEVIWYKRASTSPLLDMHRTFENITICVKGKHKFNKVYRPYTDVCESMGEFTNWRTVKGAFSTLQGILKSKEKLTVWMAALDGKHSYSDSTPRNAVSTVSDILKKEKRFISNARACVNGNQPRNLVSFIPHNKQKLDMSCRGLGDNNIKHPTVKPVELMKYLIELTTNTGDIVLDPFMGSGTTGVAAKQLNREFIGYEIDSDFFDIAKDRIDKANDNQQLGMI